MPLVLGKRMTEDEARAKRVRDFETYMQKYPGAAPNGTGSTGLMSWDASGYRELLNRQKKYLDDKNAMAGRGPMNVREGGSMTSRQRPAIDAFEAFVERSRNPYGPVTGGGIDLGRSMDLENLRGAHLRNRGLEASLALAESEGLPYGTPEQRTALDLKRRGAIGDFGREQGAKDFDQRLDQKFDEYFDPRNETMLRREDERGDARVSHAAGEQRRTLFGRDQIEGNADVTAAEIAARQREAAARMETITELLRIASQGQPVGGVNQGASRALSMFDRLAGVESKGERTMDDVRHYAQANGMTEQEALELFRANGYAVR